MDTAENGMEAVKIVKSKTRTFYQAIIQDICMPIMDGMQACVLIKQYLNDNEDGKDEHSMKSHRIRKSSKMINSPKNKRFGSNNQPKDVLRVPFVYALTSEMDKDVIIKINAAGFKKIYHMLD